MAQPAVIRRWSDTSLFLLDQGRPTVAFLLAWVSWVAYLERVILIGLTKQELSVKGAQEALGLWRGGRRNRSQEDALAVLIGVNPSHLRGEPARVWRRLQGRPGRAGSQRTTRSFRERRNGLVHESLSLAPQAAQGIDEVRGSGMDWGAAASGAAPKTASPQVGAA